jgi:hypothetical protein
MSSDSAPSSASLACEGMKVRLQLILKIRFGQESGSDRQVLHWWLHPTGCDQQSNRRPSVPDQRNQPKAIHRSRHLHIGKDDGYTFGTFEDGNGLIGIDRLDDLKPEIAHHVSRI